MRLRDGWNRLSVVSNADVALHSSAARQSVGRTPNEMTATSRSRFMVVAYGEHLWEIPFAC